MSKLWNFWWASLVYASITTIPIILNYFTSRKFKKLQETHRKEDEFYYHFIFTTIENEECRFHIYRNEECGENCSNVYLQKICKFISSATRSISLCMYTIQLESVIEELKIAQSRGINVRVITDVEMTKISKNIQGICTEEGIKIKLQKESERNMMHHKFCLVDGERKHLAKLFTGSMNLTAQALCCNFEHVLFTNNSNMIEKFVEEFEFLWDNIN